MRVLLDECVPRPLRREFPGHDVNTVVEQNIRASGIAVVVIAARSNRLKELRPLAPTALEALGRIKPGELIRVEA